VQGASEVPHTWELLLAGIYRQGAMMAVYTEHVQTVLTKEQKERLLELAKRVDKPVSVLVREAIERTYFVPVYAPPDAGAIDNQPRRQALDWLLALQAPVTDWPLIEEELAKGNFDD
jgi:hypothetical protein